MEELRECPCTFREFPYAKYRDGIKDLSGYFVTAWLLIVDVPNDFVTVHTFKRYMDMIESAELAKELGYTVTIKKLEFPVTSSSHSHIYNSIKNYLQDVSASNTNKEC